MTPHILRSEVDRRTLLAVMTALVANGIFSTAATAKNPSRLVLVHGRGQAGLDPNALKLSWLGTLRRGAKSSGLTLPDTLDVAFPYYGDTLDKFSRDFDIPL